MHKFISLILIINLMYLIYNMLHVYLSFILISLLFFLFEICIWNFLINNIYAIYIDALV